LLDQCSVLAVRASHVLLDVGRPRDPREPVLGGAACIQVLLCAELVRLPLGGPKLVELGSERPRQIPDARLKSGCRTTAAPGGEGLADPSLRDLAMVPIRV